MVTINCKICGKEKLIKPYLINSAKYCSMTCRNIGFFGKEVWNKGLKAKDHPGLLKSVEAAHKATKGKPPWNKDMKGFMGGKNNGNWKGNEVGYDGLHSWIKKLKGRATKCDNSICEYPRKNSHGVLMLSPKKFHWSNISGNYKRDINDWQQLCVSCHKLYDKEHPGNLKKKFAKFMIK